MTIQRERYDAPIAFICDECGEIDETHCEGFHGALAKVKSHGWAVRKVGDEWQHFCRDCGG